MSASRRQSPPFVRRIAVGCALALFAAASVGAQGNAPLGYQWLQAVKEQDDAKLYKISSQNQGALNAAVLDYQSDGEGAIHVAIRQGNRRYVEIMLGLGASANSVADKSGETPLTLAILADKSDLVPILLRFGARIDAANRGGETPLTKAVRQHNQPLVQLLLTRGADPDKGDYTGKTARTYAVSETRYPEIAKLLAAAPKRNARPAAGPRLN